MSKKIVFAFFLHSPKALNAHWHRLIAVLFPSVALVVLATVITARAGGPIVSSSPDLQPASSAWLFQIVDTSGDLSNLALDSSDNPHISYADGVDALNYAHWTGSTWVTETVARGVGGGALEISLALDSSDNPHISYRDAHPVPDSLFPLKYAYKRNNTWVTQTVDSSGSVGMHTSLALDRAGNPHISYYDYTNGALKYAYWTGSAWTIQTVDGGGDTGRFTSLALDGAGNPHISYCTDCYDHPTSALKYARWTGSAWVTQTVDSGVGIGHDTSLALDSAGNPHISYGGNGLAYARWTGSAWVTQTVDSDSPTGRWTSLALDSAGNPRISYAWHFSNRYGGRDYLKYAQWTSNGWDLQTVDDSAQVVGIFSSLRLDKADKPHISYCIGDPYCQLKYAVQRPPIGYTFGPDLASAPNPGEQVIYVHTLQNTGSLTDTYTLTQSSTQNWSTIVAGMASGTVALPASLTLSTDETALITVTVCVPNGTAYLGMVDTTVITATSAFSPTLVKRVTDITLVPRTRVYLPIVTRN